MVTTRERILAATNELFRRQGFNGTSLKQITVAAGAPMGSIYHFFPGGKDELAEAVIGSSGAAYQHLFELIADAAVDSADAITDFFDGAAVVLETTDFIGACPIGTVAREVASTNERLRSATERVFDSWIDAAASRFESSGLPRDAAGELAVTVVAALEGGFVLTRSARNSERLRAIGRQIRVLFEHEAAKVRPATR